jgi:hypothetical protein
MVPRRNQPVPTANQSGRYEPRWSCMAPSDVRVSFRAADAEIRAARLNPGRAVGSMGRTLLISL